MKRGLEFKQKLTESRKAIKEVSKLTKDFNIPAWGQSSIEI
jgi:hypothetical protein